jgi:hypothetical protein
LTIRVRTGIAAENIRASVRFGRVVARRHPHRMLLKLKRAMTLAIDITAARPTSQLTFPEVQHDAD